MFEGVQDDQFRQFLAASSAPIRNGSGATIGRIPTANPDTASPATATSSINLHLPPHHHHHHHPLSFSLFDGSSPDSLSIHHHHHHQLPNHPHQHHPNIHNSTIPTSNCIEYPIFEPNLPPPPHHHHQPRILPPPLLPPIHHHNLNSSNIQQPFVMHLQYPTSSDTQISKVAALTAGNVAKQQQLQQQQKQEEEDHQVMERSCTSVGFLSTNLGLQRERSSSSSVSSSTSTTSSMVLPTAAAAVAVAAASDSLIMSHPWSNEEVISLFRIRSAAAAVENSSWFTEFSNWEHVSRKLAEIGFARRPAQKCREKFEEESAKYFTSTTATAATINTNTSTTPAAAASAAVGVGDRMISNDGKNNYRVFCDLEDLYDHQPDDDGDDCDDHDHEPSYLHNHQQEEQPVVVLPPSNVEHLKNKNDGIAEKQTIQPADTDSGHEFSQQNEGQKGEITSVEEQTKRKEKGKAKIEVEVDTAGGSEETHIEELPMREEEDEIETRKSKKKRKRKRTELPTSTSTDSHHEEDKFETFKSFCEEMVRKMITHQEKLHERILRDMAKQEEEKIAREEEWKKREMERFEREMECRAKEQAVAVERQAKIIEFLNNFITNHDDTNKNRKSADSTSSDQIASLMMMSQQMAVNNLIGSSTATHHNPSSKSSYDIPTTSCDEDDSRSQTSNSLTTIDPKVNKHHHRLINPRMKKKRTISNIKSEDNNAITGGSNQQLDITGNRWPREEVLALINVRCNIDLYNNSNNNNDQNNNKAAPLWERISRRMMEMGYKRSAKRCKEKWENINKYFRKTKDVKRKKSRCADSRTCPYFHQLSHLYSGQMVQGGGGSTASRKNVNVVDHIEDDDAQGNNAAVEDQDDDDDNENDVGGSGRDCADNKVDNAD